MHLERSGTEAEKIQKLVCVVSHWLEGNSWTQESKEEELCLPFQGRDI